MKKRFRMASFFTYITLLELLKKFNSSLYKILFSTYIDEKNDIKNGLYSIGAISEVTGQSRQYDTTARREKYVSR
jgi:hypothetical protein